MAAEEAVCMNCSVRSLLAFMFYGSHWPDLHQPLSGCSSIRNPSYSHLRPQLQDVLESHSHACQPTLKHHDHVIVVFLYHALLFALDPLSLLLLGYDETL
jgi:hypothetical protein